MVAQPACYYTCYCLPSPNSCAEDPSKRKCAEQLVAGWKGLMVARHSLLIVLTNNHLFVVLLLYLELRRPLVVLILGEQRRPFKGEAGDQLVSGWKEGGGEPQVALCVCFCAHTVSVSVRALCLCLCVCTVSVSLHCVCLCRHCVCAHILSLTDGALAFTPAITRALATLPFITACNLQVYIHTATVLLSNVRLVWCRAQIVSTVAQKHVITGLCAKDIASSWFKVCSAGGARRK